LVSKTVNSKSPEIDKDKSGIDAQNSIHGNFDSEQLKLINEFSSVRDSIVRSVANRFPMKGLDTLLKQAFDEAVAENLGEIKRYFSWTVSDKPQTEERPTKKSKNAKAPNETPKKLHEPELKKPVVDNSTVSKSPNRTDGSPQESTKSRNSNLMVEDYQKKVEQLILEIKVRDKKLKENEEHIETLKSQLEILEQQNMPPFLDNWKLEDESGKGDIEQLQNQIRYWEILWQKMRNFFKEDPKFKTLSILQRLGSISIKNLCQALNLESNQIESLLRELQESSFIILDGDILKIKTD
jgi:small-conductance mechanosensitive channel